MAEKVKKILYYKILTKSGNAFAYYVKYVFQNLEKIDVIVSHMQGNENRTFRFFGDGTKSIFKQMIFL